MRIQNSIVKVVISVGGLVSALLGAGWLGLHVRPAAFPAMAQRPSALETVPLPASLPAPVERFYRKKYGERIPVITSAVITGRGTIRPFGTIRFPMRFRFIHNAGRDYRHYIEATLFGIPFMKVNEYYVNGKERMELPFGVQENDVRLDQAGNLGMWAEILGSLPAALLTDPRVRWEDVDDNTALLVVPFESEQERFVVRFDPATGMPWLTEVMRYQNVQEEKKLWITESLPGGYGSATWLEDGSPWLVMKIEDETFNVEVDTSFTAKGP